MKCRLFHLKCIPPERALQNGQFLLSSANQSAFVKVHPTIWTQILLGPQQLDSSMSLTFFQELLLGKQTQAPRPGFFNWYLSQARFGEENPLKNPRRSRGFGYRVSNPLPGPPREARQDCPCFIRGLWFRIEYGIQKSLNLVFT